MSAKQKFLLIFLIFVLFFIGIFVYFIKFVNPIIFALSEAQVQALAVKSLNKSFDEVLNGTTVYSNLIEIGHDNEGNVSNIIANTVAINQLNHTLLQISQNNIELIGEQGVNIPLGNFTGLPIFSGRGPDIRIKVMPVGSMSAEYISNFISAGINQTNHKIFIRMTSNITLVMPAMNKKIKTTTDLLVCEGIIVGKVPEVYLNSNQLDEMLNLVPKV